MCHIMIPLISFIITSPTSCLSPVLSTEGSPVPTKSWESMARAKELSELAMSRGLCIAHGLHCERGTLLCKVYIRKSGTQVSGVV